MANKSITVPAQDRHVAPITDDRATNMVVEDVLASLNRYEGILLAAANPEEAARVRDQRIALRFHVEALAGLSDDTL